MGFGVALLVQNLKVPSISIQTGNIKALALKATRHESPGQLGVPSAVLNLNVETRKGIY